MISYESLVGATDPITPRTLRSKYALGLSIVAVVLAFCALISTVFRFQIDLADSSIGSGDEFLSTENRSGAFSKKKGRGPRPLLIAEEDLSLKDLEALLASDTWSTKYQSIVSRIKGVTASEVQSLAGLLQENLKKDGEQVEQVSGKKNASALKIKADGEKEN